MFARPNYDSAKADTLKPSFKQADQTITFQELKYNFKSQRALVQNAHTQYGDGFVIGEVIKRNKDQSINSHNSIYTTCNNEHPHFGIYSKKIKVIPNTVAVAGKSNLVIEDIPTPLVLPFAIYPLKKGQRSGFILPRYRVAQFSGFGLTDLGYYLPISEKLDAILNTDIYFNGTWRAGLHSNYTNKYRFGGSVDLNYNFTKVGDEFEQGNLAQKDFSINWVHSIDGKARPGTNFSANVNFRTSGYNRLVYSNNINNLTQNITTSTISYSKTWQGKPYNFTASAGLNQNLTSHDMSFNLPTMTFSINQLSPFQRKNIVGKPRWYEQINMSYTANMINQIDLKDSNFRSEIGNLENYRNGIQQTIPISFSQKVLKYVNFSTNATYNEYWYSQRSFRYYDPTQKKQDTTQNFGFYTARSYQLSASLGTRIFGTFLFKKGNVKGIRHEMRPSISFNYNPNFADPKYNYYYQTFTDPSYVARTISYFENAAIPIPIAGKNGSINFSLDNVLQMKVKNGKDTSTGTKKVSLLDGFSLSTGYNFAIDSFNLAPLNINYRTNLFNKININGGAQFDPYYFDYTAKRKINVYELAQTGKILNFNNFRMSVGGAYQTNSKTGTSTEQKLKSKNDISQAVNDYVDFEVPFNVSYTYNANLTNTQVIARQKDSLVFNHSFTLNGGFSLTPKWKATFYTGYNFTLKDLSVTRIEINRDLHCWQMSLTATLNGFQKGYVFTLRPKANSLQELKLNRTKDFRDNF